MKRVTDPDVQLLQAAADPVRLAILRQLSADGPTCACDFSDCCDISQSTVSHHLKVLREAGWIQGERRGTWIWYAIRPQAVERFGSIAGGMHPGIAKPAANLGPAPSSGPTANLGPAPSLGPTPDDARALPVLQADWRQW